MKREFIITVFCLGFIIFAGLLAAEARAATLTVTKVQDTNDNVCDADCSLREAIFAAEPGDTIEFTSPLFDAPQTIVLSGTELVISKNLTVNGRGANLTVISGNNASRVFSNSSFSSRVTLSGLTVTGGRVGINRDGAGIFNSGIMTVINCIVSGNSITGNANSGGSGGGIYNEGTMKIIGSVVSHNLIGLDFNGRIGGGYGGGIFNYYRASMTIINSTVSNNTINVVNLGRGGGIFGGVEASFTVINSTISGNAINGPSEGGGIRAFASRLVNNIVAGNFPSNINLESSPTPGINNFINADPRVSPIGNYGGATYTLALRPDSPAIDAGSNCVLTENGCGFAHDALTNDQRGLGFARLSGSSVDIGSVEYTPISFVTETLPLGFPNTDYSQQINVTGGYPAYGYTLESGNLPSGFILSAGGLLSGTTAQTGVFDFVVRLTDASGIVAVKSYVLLIGNRVDNAYSSGTGSLRQVINDTPAGGTIVFDPDFFNQPRTIVDRLDIFKNLTIIGPGSKLLTINGDSGGRVLNIDGPTVSISGIRFTGGSAGAGVSAGGILINSGGTLNGTDIIVENCSAGVHGGGIYNTGKLNLTDSTVRGNTAGQLGGGIYNGGVTMTITRSTISGNTGGTGGGVYTGSISIINNSTISGNSAAAGGGAVFIQSGSRLDTTNTTITDNVSNSNQIGGIFNQGLYQTRNSIIAGNRNLSGAGNGDLNGDIASYGWNLFGNTSGTNIYSTGTGGQTLTGNLYNVAANLAPLGNYGGATETHALLSNSPAINAASDSFTTDQRGSERKIGAAVDTGAFEQNIAFDQPSTLPNSYTNSIYSQQLSATRQTSLARNGSVKETQSLAPATFEIVPINGEQLPPGLTLSPGGLISGTPAEGGTFAFTVKATDTDGIAGVQQFTIQVFAPTAATVTASGKVLTADGRGLVNAMVVMTDAAGNSRTARTSTFGYYRFNEVEAGQTYIFTVFSKSYQFAPQVVIILEDLSDLNFVAQTN